MCSIKDFNFISKEAIILIKKYGFSKEEFIIGAGASLLYHGIRSSTSDVDVSTNNKKLFYKLLAVKPNHVFKRTDGSEIQVVSISKHFDLQLYEGSYPVDMEYEYTPEGVCVETLKSVYRFKLKLNREKDHEDINKIRNKLGL